MPSKFLFFIGSEKTVTAMGKMAKATGEESSGNTSIAAVKYLAMVRHSLMNQPFQGIGKDNECLDTIATFLWTAVGMLAGILIKYSRDFVARALSKPTF